MLRFLLFLLLVLLMPAAVSASALILPVEGQFVLDSVVEHLEDAESSLSPDQAREVTDGEWANDGDNAFNQGMSDSAWWFRLQIANPGNQISERLLEIAYPLLDEVEVYVYEGDRQLLSYQLGDSKPYIQRPLDHHHYLIPLSWTPDQSLTILVRVRSSGPVWVPFALWSHDSFVGHDGARALARGLFSGALAIFVVYNFLLFLSVRERSYLYYVCSYTCLLLFTASFSGLSFRYIWPTSVTWNEYAVPVLLFGTSIFGNLLTCELLRLREQRVRLARLFQFGAFTGAVLIAATFVMPYRGALTLAMIYGAVSFGAAFITGLRLLPSGHLTERLFTAALAVAFVCSLPGSLAAIDLMPVNVVSTQSTHVGTIIAALLLSFALASRITDDRRLRQLAHLEALETTRKAKSELERRVQERTLEQHRLSEHLQELSITDSLTGARNRRHLEERLAEEWQRGGCSRRSLAVILLDADHFKTVNDTYGHAAGDACLQEIARRAHRCLQRPADLFARFGGEEFCVLLPETNEDGARVMAQRIRVAVSESPVEFENFIIPLTISAGVAAGIPDPDTRPEPILKQADQALYAAKEGGRNKVCSTSLSDPGSAGGIHE